MSALCNPKKQLFLLQDPTFGTSVHEKVVFGEQKGSTEKEGWKSLLIYAASLSFVRSDAK